MYILNIKRTFIKTNRQIDKKYNKQVLHKRIYSSGQICSISLIIKETQIKTE